MSSTPVVQTNELTKVYSHPLWWWRIRARALTDLTITVEPGEIYGLLGPNGSGKTTTIKLLLGLLFPTKGAASLFGRRPSDLEVKGRIGYLPEESYLYRFLDAEETLDFYGRLFSLPRQERRRRTEALLDLTGLRAERRRPVGEYSKGMQRRIGIAQSLINDPEFLILDEPTSGLDPIGIREVKDIILQLREKGKTVLLSSHLLADVEDVCDRVAILYGGRLRVEGPVKSLLADEERVQVTASLSPADQEALREWVRARARRPDEVRFGPPVERLEQFFLRVVEEAQAQGTSTSGAQSGVGSLDFLGTDATRPTLLESLTAGDESRSAQGSTPTAASEVGTPPPNSRVLDALSEALAPPDARPADDTPRAATSAEPASPNSTRPGAAPASGTAAGDAGAKAHALPDAPADVALLDQLVQGEGEALFGMPAAPDAPSDASSDASSDARRDAKSPNAQPPRDGSGRNPRGGEAGPTSDEAGS